MSIAPEQPAPYEAYEQVDEKGEEKLEKVLSNAAEGKKHTIALRVAQYVVLVLIAVLMLFPLLWQLSTSLKAPGLDLYSRPPELIPSKFSGAAYSRVFEVIPVWEYVLNSLFVAAITVVGNVVGASAAGYALAKMKFRGKKIAFGVFLIGILVPAEVILIARYLLVQSMGLGDTLIAVALPGLVGALNVLLMTNAINGIPDSIEEAAMIDGANAWQRFVRIVLPSVKGTMAVVAIFSFVGAWDEFLWPLIVLSDQSKYTLTVGLNFLKGTFANDPRVVAAGTMIAIIPLIILFFTLQKYFFQGVGEGGVKG